MVEYFCTETGKERIQRSKLYVFLSSMELKQISCLKKKMEMAILIRNFSLVAVTINIMTII